MGTIWGYTTDHIMTDPAEAKAINDSGVQNKFGGDWVVGDIKYVNLDDDPNINDGNQTLEDHGDLSIIGNDTPAIILVLASMQTGTVSTFRCFTRNHET